MIAARAGRARLLPMPLNRVLARIRERAPSGRPVAVFDLDSTLFSTQKRNLAILREWAAGDAPEGARLIVARLTDQDMGWNVMDDLRRHGFSHEPTLKELRRFWFERFFKDEYLLHDEPLPGAPEFVRDCHAAGGTVVYLTGRDEPGMGRGTRLSLERHGFPLGDERVALRLKPTFDEPDLAFKERVIEELKILGEVVAAFENEPANANLFCDAFPEADVIFLETVHSPNPPPLRERIVRVKDFRGRGS